MGRGAIHLSAVGAVEPEHMATKFDDRHLHTQTDSQIRNTVFTRITHRLNLPFDTALAEAAGHEDCIHAIKRARAVLLQIRRLDVMDVDARAGLKAAVRQSLVE